MRLRSMTLEPEKTFDGFFRLHPIRVAGTDGFAARRHLKDSSFRADGWGLQTPVHYRLPLPPIHARLLHLCVCHSIAVSSSCTTITRRSLWTMHNSGRHRTSYASHRDYRTRKKIAFPPHFNRYPSQLDPHSAATSP